MIVFVLRHADRTEEDALKSPEGFERAKLLARILSEMRIGTAYLSDTARANATLQPLKDVLGDKLEVKTVPLDEHAPAPHVHEIIAAVTALLPANTTAVVVSHAGTVEPIIKGLTGKTVSDIGKDEFDKLFVLSVTAAGAGTVAMLRYGAPTPPLP
jgi:phosphohistidine phosphatase SixA